MARTPITPLRLDPAVKADWTARAQRAGLSLSEFVRREVDRDKLTAAVPPMGNQARPFSKEQQAGRGKR